MSEWLFCHGEISGHDLFVDGTKIESCANKYTFVWKKAVTKPAYNLQHGGDSEYIVWLTIGPQPTDTTTLKPFIQSMERHLSFKYRNIVADAGYESEENYLFLEENGQLAFIKPTNYEISRIRKYKADPGRRENMTYDPEADEYTCQSGRKLSKDGVIYKKSSTGYYREITRYSCKDCSGCSQEPIYIR